MMQLTEEPRMSFTSHSIRRFLAEGVGILRRWLPIPLLLAALSSWRCAAATLVVYNTNDSGAGSLRQAIADDAAMGGANTIMFSNSVTGTIILATGELLINNNVTILGPGAGKLAVDGNALSRVFHIGTNFGASISGLTITNGASLAGGGIYVDQAELTLSNCIVSGNLATNGGGIYNNGKNSASLLILANSTLSGNFARSAAGGIFNDGSSMGIAQLEMRNCTLNSNSASGGVGGIYNFAPNGDAEALVLSTTFSGNSGNGAGGILSFAAMYATTVQVGNTILKAGVSGPNLVSGGVAAFISDGYNLCSDNGGGVLTNTTDQINTDPLLGPLRNNGGPTPTMAPSPNSPAIDKGNSFGLTTDQRGAPRPFDFPSIPNASGGDGSDVGAFELGRPLLSATSIPPGVVVSWPSFYGDFNLESVTMLSGANDWSSVSNVPAAVGAWYNVTNVAPTGNTFYRLKSR
jgi:hypothetical protein